MKKIVVAIMFIMLITGCSSNNNVENDSQEEVKEKIIEYYKYDESINLFINKYNKMFDPDIDSSMISKKRIGGSDRDDVVSISVPKLEVNIYAKGFSDEMSVYVGYLSKDYSNDDMKVYFVRFIKMFDEKITDDKIEQIWNDVVSGNRSGSFEINNIEVWPSYLRYDGKLDYFKITSEIVFDK